MRILVLGAGGTGGYFGGRLAQSGADVVFLVRPSRAEQLREHGLQLRSALGDADLPVAWATAETLPGLAARKPFGLVLLSCKAYDLDSSIEAIEPAMTGDACVLPILNGLRHYAALDKRFGREQVLGGLCFIVATKGAGGIVRHMGRAASILFGERDGDPDSARTAAFSAACLKAGIDHVRSMRIAQQQWEKYAFLTALAAGTCLMRNDIGHIVAADDGADFMRSLYRECVAVAEAEGEAISPEAQATALDIVLERGSRLTASMLRDLQAGYPIEAEQIVGDMLQRARRAGQDAPLLTMAWCHLQAYQAQT
ncbi:MAG: 2-dehydropantoate 2-reductase [Xanthomonadaceae bacterium]|nr:2-dehydropantoate 2-reductase [Xanthomonadaceae bacterium]